MNRRQIEVEKLKLAKEKKLLTDLRRQYKSASDDISLKVKKLQDQIDKMVEEFKDYPNNEVMASNIRSKVYQRNYQKQLKAQIDASVSAMDNSKNRIISKYLEDAYTTGFIGTMYDMHGQGVPLIIPMDRRSVANALQLDSKISRRLYGGYTDELKERIRSEISRGISTNIRWEDTARNIANVTNVSISKTMRIARTEGHRIQISSAVDAMKSAKEAGADILKQWDATLDGATRDTHRELDGKIAELDEDFEYSEGAVTAPGMFGDPAEDCNCRCALLQRARWELDEEELDTLKERSEYFGIDKTKDFEDFQGKYLNSLENGGESGTIRPAGLQIITKKTQHASERMESRKISDEEIEDALKNPLFKGKASVKFYSDNGK